MKDNLYKSMVTYSDNLHNVYVSAIVTIAKILVSMKMIEGTDKDNNCCYLYQFFQSSSWIQGFFSVGSEGHVCGVQLVDFKNVLQ